MITLPIYLYLIKQTHAIQGIIVSLIGVGIYLYFEIRRKFNKKIEFGYLVIAAISFVTIFLGMLQIGPLTKYLYKNSITDRGYNWRAALKMFQTHPWTGVGLDNYASYFPTYRDSKYPLIYGYIQIGRAHV